MNLHRLISGKLLIPPAYDIHILRVQFHHAAPAPCLLRSDKRRSGPAEEVEAAYQPFEHGFMLWLRLDATPVIWTDGPYSDNVYVDRWTGQEVAFPELPPDGLLIANMDDTNVGEIAATAPCPVQSYGVDPSFTWTIKNVRVENRRSHFEIVKDGKPWAAMTVGLPGRHNCLNSLAVCAVMHHLGIAPPAIRQGLEQFGGVKRRQEVRGIEGGVTVIDDFAHHPTAVRETLAALKSGYADQRLIAVFEPRTNSSRRAVFQNDYVGAFDAADMILLKEPAPIEGLAEEELFSSARLAADLRSRKQLAAEAFSTTDDILSRLRTILREGDVVAILSNGGFDNIHTRLLKQLQGPGVV